MVLTIEAREVLKEAALGDSIAVNGICLTVTNFDTASFSVDVMPETMYRTSLKEAAIGSRVNLERAMTPNRRFGGHFVAGHVDGVAVLVNKILKDNAVYLSFQTNPELIRYMVPKGSIALDGISLTLVDIKNDQFSVSIIPHTLKQTNLEQKRIGDAINVEVDMIGKFVEKSVRNILEQGKKEENNLTEAFLKENGFA